jgi:transposase InsO family protein
MAKHLHYLTRQDVPFKWTKECQQAFEELKRRMASALILCHYRSELPSRIETDASDSVIAAVFSQLQKDGQWYPVAYFSRTMTSAEFNYDIHDKEMLAIVAALKEWRAELVGLQREERFEILSDHLALQYFMTTKQLTGRQARWCELLHQYYFIIKHRPGKENTLADALTRREGLKVDRKGQRAQLMLPKECLGPSEIRETLGGTSNPVEESSNLGTSEVELSPVEYQEDVVARIISANLKDVECEDLRELARKGDNDWTLVNDVLQFRKRVYVPEDGDLRARLLDEIHRQPSTAHPGKNKMKILVRERYYWKTWSKDVERYVDNCMVCKRTNTRRDLPPGLLQPLPIPARPWQHVSMDFMTYPVDKGGYDTVFVIVDRFSKIPISVLCHKNIDARGLARLWVKHAYPRTGPPDSIVSDRGPQFVSEFWGEVCRILRIKVVLSTADHAQTNGQTKIANQYLSQRLRPFVNHF